MVTVTPKAAEQIKGLLESQGKMEGMIRIYLAGYGCSGPQYAPALDMEKKEDDVAINSNGINLVYSKDLDDDLKEYELDYIETPYGNGFIVRNPNAVCGEGCSGCH
ncbi:iron-sulfur cluster assembly accessory protein [Methanocella sp. CWC-04]|uniref:Iron-sulfur cluster assembly accessory protein n=1 Tax=Methanooceanicella nereidis TaxID=2052831 RepID=A0AAP2RDT7_9EURY|nr:iron-sulfur cluster assembly accessory protein [Methanocella sp. CWC-04]